MRTLAALLIFAALAAPATASTFNISPIRAELSGSHRTEALTIMNADDSPVVVQIRVVRWSQKDGAEQLEDTRELLATPPVLQIAANGQQIIRVALRRDPDSAQELTYRVIFEEVPQAAPKEFTGLRVALRLSIPVFVAPAHGKAKLGTGVAVALASQRSARSGGNQQRQRPSANHGFRGAISRFVDAAARNYVEVRAARKPDELDLDAAGGRKETGNDSDPRSQRPGRFFRRRRAQRSLKSRDWRAFMTRLNRIAYALQTYSGVLLMLCLAAHGAIAADAPQLTEAVLEVTLSKGEPGEMIVVLRGRGGQLYLEEGDFARLRLQLPPSAPYLHDGRRFFDVKAIKGCTVTIDEAAQRAVIAVPATSLDTTHLSAAARRSPDITPASPGAFLNYQLSAQQINGQNIGGAFAELGAFAGAGVVTNTAVARYGNNDNQLVRLDTTYTRDFPASLDTLNLGDAISDGGQLGQRACATRGCVGAAISACAPIY